MIPVDRTKPWHQTNWDWRAAMNFILGGSGSGLLIALPAGPPEWYAPLAIIGAAAIAGGLLFVWMEIGRPLRALNVFIHLKTSWMTRESWVAPAVLGLSVLAASTGSVLLHALAGAAAALFLYCQGRILTASKGIPAWRLPIVAPIIVLSGLLEGIGLVVITLVVLDRLSAQISVGIAVCVLLRGVFWRFYARSIFAGSVPEKVKKALTKYFPVIELTGSVVPAAFLAGALFFLWPALAGVAAGLAIVGGWYFKFVLVTRLGYNQGFALPNFPNRGKGNAGTATKPGWQQSTVD